MSLHKGPVLRGKFRIPWPVTWQSSAVACSRGGIPWRHDP